MDREEILNKSRHENQQGDEREKQIQLQGESFGLLFLMVTGVVLVVWKVVHGEAYRDIMLMFWMSLLGSRLYRLAIGKRKSEWPILLICLFFAIWNGIQFFCGGI